MKYILFDLDGTLTESGIGIKRCVQYALEHFNINENNDDKLRLFIGPPLFDSFTKRYGLTEEQANKAGLLHTISKNFIIIKKKFILSKWLFINA